MTKGGGKSWWKNSIWIQLPDMTEKKWNAKLSRLQHGSIHLQINISLSPLRSVDDIVVDLQMDLVQNVWSKSAVWARNFAQEAGNLVQV